MDWKSSLIEIEKAQVSKKALSRIPSCSTAHCDHMIVMTAIITRGILIPK